MLYKNRTTAKNYGEIDDEFSLRSWLGVGINTKKSNQINSILQFSFNSIVSKT